MTVKDNVILVTGASRGIGAAIYRRLAGAGGRVIAVARTQDQLDALMAELRPHRADVMSICADLCDPTQVQRIVDTVGTQVGRLDALVNNAGVAWMKPLAETSLEAWRGLLAVNLDAVFLLTRGFMPLFREQGRGQIVNIGSDASIRGIGGMSCYCASKFALRGFTMAVREELKGSGIRVNLVMPGPVNTTIIAETAERWELVQPEDVAEIVWQVLALPARADVWEVLVEPGR